uniref:Uncharacterized protein n=1 Tax=Timema cristinae TaxID=61476 RepID=A0A7R9C9I5_TIMCR|nr:unnamed protein product [Timema cristinae]
MYDDDARCAGMGQHWYDEPPYESDPEDFLMGTTGQAVPTATIQNGSPHKLSTKYYLNCDGSPVIVYLLAALGVLLVSMCFPLPPGAVSGFHSPQLISSLLSQKIQQKLMTEVEITFQEALNVGLRLEEADRQVKVFVHADHLHSSEIGTSELHKYVEDTTQILDLQQASFQEIIHQKAPSPPASLQRKSQAQTRQINQPISPWEERPQTSFQQTKLVTQGSTNKEEDSEPLLRRSTHVASAPRRLNY